MISRRNLLKTLLGGAATLPLLSSPLARATPPKFPQRFIYFHTPNGSLPEYWTPTGGETDFVLSPILEPLEPHRKKILVLDGIDLESSYHGPGGDVGHANGMGHVLTGTELLEGGYESAMGGGISIDQAIAKAIGKDTKLPSLELGVQTTGPTGWIRVNYTAPGVSLPMENDPARVFDRVFAGLGADPLGVARLRAHKKSVLDAVTQELESSKKILSASDREKLETHLAAVRSMETRLASEPLLGASCKKPDAPPAGLVLSSNDNYPVLGKLQIDLMVMAMACDVTRVGTLLWAGAANNAQVFDWIGLAQSHHELTHLAPAEANDRISKVMNWYAQQFAYLIGALDAIPEGSGTMLDHTTLLWGSELSVGNTHNRRGMPFVVAGGGAGFKTGRYLKFKSATPHNDLLTSLARGHGIDASTFGNPAYCNGPLGRLVS